MNRIPGIIFHTLKGITIRGNVHDHYKLDVAKIIKTDYRERLFCIFDRDKPYTLTVRYYEPTVKWSFAPTIGAGGFGGAAFYNETTLEKTIEKRYGSEVLIKQEISAIQKKMNYLDGMAHKLAHLAKATFDHDDIDDTVDLPRDHDCRFSRELGKFNDAPLNNNEMRDLIELLQQIKAENERLTRDLTEPLQQIVDENERLAAENMVMTSRMALIDENMELVLSKLRALQEDKESTD